MAAAATAFGRCLTAAVIVLVPAEGFSARALAGVALECWAVRVAHRPRRLELAADLHSIELVGLDGAATLRHLRGREVPLDRLVSAAGFTTHPSAAQRLGPQLGGWAGSVGDG